MPAPKGIPIPARVAERAFNKWEPSPSGCRISTYSTASHGYAQIGWQDGTFRTCITAHRAAWVHVNGQIPLGMTVDHRPTCDRRCVNVNHLRLLSNFENGRRTSGRDWPLGECAHGHSNENLIREPSGRRRCRLCKQNTDKVSNAKRAQYKREWQQAKRQQLRNTA